ncbi:MAG: hypothetical protein M1453_12985 [Acidobacteria bacterium]|nr:hypothetical protein [Acidobacteriota bacterium]MCL5288891.1 hypothetical protein [Acidobacteriota bacterium]
MNPNRESLLLAGTEAFILLVCLGAIIWAIASGLIFDIDGLLLVAISLSLAAVFAFTLLLQAKSAGWLDKLPLPGRKKAAAQNSPAGDAK